MPFAAGVYTLPALNPVVTATTISSTWANNTMNDIATALSTAVLKDGTQTITANIPMAGFKFTGLGAGGSAGNSVRYEEVFTTGGVGFLGNIAVAGSVSGPLYVAGTFGVSGNVAVSGNLTVSGNTVFHGVTSTGATGTGNIVYASTPTVTSPVLNTGVSGTALAANSDMDAATSSSLIVTPILNRISLGTSTATTTGTTIDFINIPSGTRRIGINPLGISTTGVNPYLLQIGGTGGIETTGYTSVAKDGAAITSVSGLLFTTSVSGGEAIRGAIVLALEASGTFTWVSHGVIGGATTYISAGSKSTGTELTQLRITTSGSTNLFDAGAINIQFER